ncbi:MAG: creatininase family protein [Pirellulales bacterium]|nr:creatininase family protein [Pirellulales bacterium]
MKWQELKWPAVQALDKQLPVVIPLGSVEQHGHHLPLCTDTLQVSAIADALEAELENQVLMLPTLWLGSSHHHLDFPGTLSIRPSLYTRLLQDLTTSILHSGFKRLFFLNGHGGNETPAAQALMELASTDELAQDALLAMASWWTVGKPDREQLCLQSPAISHACEYETSLMLWLRPELVDITKASDVAPAIDSPWLTGTKRVALYQRFASMTTTGNLDTPTLGTADKGKAIFDAVVVDIVGFIKDFVHWPRPHPARHAGSAQGGRLS